MARARRMGPFGYVNLWVRRIRRMAVIASLAAAFYRWWQGRPGRGAWSRRRRWRDGMDGADRRAAITFGVERFRRP